MDACPAGVGAVLAQGQDWKLSRPAAFMSKKFTATQCSYFGYELEALSMLEALTKWIDELTGGQKFTVVTDHKALTYFKAKQHTTGHHIRWQNFFSGFNCDIVYIEGHKNKVTDALSQYYNSSKDDDIHYNDLVSADIKINKNGEDLPLNCSEEAKKLLHNTKWYTGFTAVSVSDSVEQCQVEADTIDPPIRCVRGIIIENTHKIVGHFSYHKTITYMHKLYWWSTMNKDTKKFCTSCEACQTTKRCMMKQHGLLHQLPIPD